MVIQYRIDACNICREKFELNIIYIIAYVYKVHPVLLGLAVDGCGFSSVIIDL